MNQGLSGEGDDAASVAGATSTEGMRRWFCGRSRGFPRCCRCGHARGLGPGCGCGRGRGERRGFGR